HPAENPLPTLRKNTAHKADANLLKHTLPPAPAGLDADGDAGDMAALALLLGQVSTLMAGIAARNAQPAG
ncbi:hypothetical protein PMS51_10690, partial [Bifidobacterium longum]|nr:hypothetical protein [Bifidobacterium longum]MDB6820099.1 hypothetical protein [Bifidobacterium longum]